MFTWDVSDGTGMQTSCKLSNLEEKQSVLHEDMPQVLKQVPTSEQKVTICDDQVPKIAAGQDRFE